MRDKGAEKRRERARLHAPSQVKRPGARCRRFHPISGPELHQQYDMEISPSQYGLQTVDAKCVCEADESKSGRAFFDAWFIMTGTDADGLGREREEEGKGGRERERERGLMDRGGKRNR